MCDKIRGLTAKIRRRKFPICIAFCLFHLLPIQFLLCWLPSTERSSNFLSFCVVCKLNFIIPPPALHLVVQCTCMKGPKRSKKDRVTMLSAAWSWGPRVNTTGQLNGIEPFDLPTCHGICGAGLAANEPSSQAGPCVVGRLLTLHVASEWQLQLVLITTVAAGTNNMLATILSGHSTSLSDWLPNPLQSRLCHVPFPQLDGTALESWREKIFQQISLFLFWKKKKRKFDNVFRDG